MKRVRPRASAIPLGAGLLAFVLGGGSCDDPARSVDAPYTAPRPAHPAMTAPVSAASAAHGPELPPGHLPAGGAASGAKSVPRAAPGALARGLRTLGLTAALPEGWVEESSTSQFRLATLRLPRIEGDEADGELSVTAAGGTVEANIERWRGQFSEAPEPITRERTTPGGIEVTLVEMAGTFSAGGMGQPSTPQPGTRLLGAVAKIPGGGEQLLFLKGWGPAATMERWKEAFEAFVDSLAPAG